MAKIWEKVGIMTKINSKLFPKKSSELARSSELAPSELAQHPCMLVLESPKFTNPSLVFDDDVMKVWHYQDIIYSTPKGLVLF